MTRIYFCSHYNVNGLLTNDLTKIVAYLGESEEGEEGLLGGWYKRCKSLPILSQEVHRKYLILQKNQEIALQVCR